jgi:hypothetical protein
MKRRRHSAASDPAVVPRRETLSSGSQRIDGTDAGRTGGNRASLRGRSSHLHWRVFGVERIDRHRALGVDLQGRRFGRFRDDFLFSRCRNGRVGPRGLARLLNRVVRIHRLAAGDHSRGHDRSMAGLRTRDASLGRNRLGWARRQHFLRSFVDDRAGIAAAGGTADGAATVAMSPHVAAVPRTTAIATAATTAAGSTEDGVERSAHEIGDRADAPSQRGKNSGITRPTAWMATGVAIGAVMAIVVENRPFRGAVRAAHVAMMAHGAESPHRTAIRRRVVPCAARACLCPARGASQHAKRREHARYNFDHHGSFSSVPAARHPAPHRVFHRPLGPSVGSGGVLTEKIEPAPPTGKEETFWQEMSTPPPSFSSPVQSSHSTYVHRIRRCRTWGPVARGAGI